MSGQEKISRLLRLVSLMSGNIDYTVEALADKLDISPRTVYRYIETFKDSGFVVDKLAANIYKLKSMPEEYPDFSNLVYFSEEEAHLVNALIDRLDPSNALKANLQKKLAVIYDSTNLAELASGRPMRQIVETLARGIRDKKQVVLKGYESSHSHSVRDRLVEPFAFTTNYVDVWAYDLSDGKNKSFKLSRMESAMLLDEVWEHESEHHKSSVDIFRMSGERSVQLRLSLSLMARNLLVEEYPLADKYLTSLRDGRYLLDAPVYNFAGPCRFYLGLAPEIDILSPSSFKEYVRNFVSSYLKG